MIRRGILAVGAVMLVSALLFGREAVSYVGTSVGWVKESVRDSIPIEFEIQRARDLIASLVPDIRKNMHTIATEEVEVEQLATQIASMEQSLGKDRAELARLQDDLSSGDERFQYAGRSYSADQVAVDLARRFERFKTKNATLDSLKEMHEARQASLMAARDKLEGMLAARRQLEVDVQHLEARLQMVEAAQTTSQVTVDDSRLSRVKELVQDLKTRLDVAERLVNSDGYYHDEIPLDAVDASSVLEEMSAYFGDEPSEDEAY